MVSETLMGSHVRRETNFGKFVVKVLANNANGGFNLYQQLRAGIKIYWRKYFKPECNLELGVNIKIVLGLPKAKQLGLEHFKKIKGL